MPEKVSGNNFSAKSDLTSLNSNHTSIEPKSAVQLNSTEQKLETLQKMADDSPYSQRFAHLTSMANNSIQKQPVSQLSKDSHSLPDNVKQGVESLSGISLDDVKVHYNSAKPAQLNAHAYAQGTDIHIASGQEKHLPHEAWHVVQQKQGRVQPTTMMKGKVPINDDQGLEKEADVMGARALQMKPFSLSDYMTEKSVQRKEVVQKAPKSDAEARWDAHIDPEERQATSNDRDVLDDAKSAREEEKIQGNRLETIPEGNLISFGSRDKIDGDKNVLDEAKSAGEEKERISSLKLSKIKFNFAGSGEEEWKTHKEKYDEDGKRKEGFEDAEHIHGGKKRVKEKENKEEIGTRSMVVEYAGPIDKILWKKGSLDTGSNSTEKNLEDAQGVLIKSLEEINDSLETEDSQESKIEKFNIGIDIKGFSRGAATASAFAAWAKDSKWGGNLTINLLLIDPVDGHKLNAKMESEVDVTKVFDPSVDSEDRKNDTNKDYEEKPDKTGTTLMMPIQSGHWFGFFTPQKIKGYQRLILIFGSKAKHSFGLGEDEESTLHWNNNEIKGMGLTKLPRGLFVVNSEQQPLTICKVNLTMWENYYEAAVLGKANKSEERDQVIKNALDVELEKYMK